LDHEKQVLGENIKQMYLDGQESTLELLASSSNLSDFIDREQYRTSVETKIKDTVNEINALKAKLESQQKELQALIADEQNQQNELAGERNQQTQLLAYTEDQK